MTWNFKNEKELAIRRFRKREFQAEVTSTAKSYRLEPA